MSKNEIPQTGGPVLDLRHAALAQKSAAAYFKICADRTVHPVVRHFRRTRHFLVWVAGLLLPDSVVEYPSLRANLKALRKHPHFKPVRMAVVAWIIFALTMGSAGVYSLINAPTTLAADPWYNVSWLYRTKITFDNSAQASNLTDFPVMVKLNSSRIDYAHTQNSGQDIRFTDSDGITLLPYEIEDWDEAGNSFVWVKIPQINASSNTDYIYIYYGNTSATDGQTATAVWDANYEGVWHLSENPAGAAPQTLDSTSNNNDGTSVGSMTAEDQVPGQTNGSLDFDGVDDYVNAGDSVSLDSNNWTISIWLNPPSLSVGNYQRILSYYGDGPTIWKSNGGGILSIVHSGTIDFATNITMQVDVWQHIVITRAGSVITAYLNGSQTAQNTSFAAVYTANTVVSIGNSTAFNEPYLGLIDEVRILNTARSAAWIAATYKSETDTFNTFGSEEIGNLPPATPSNSSPANGATGQGLNPTLTGSAYSDPESEPQTDAGWQVDDDSDFSSPVWTRTAGAAETSIAVTAANGTFANELSGKTVLDHNTAYYWRVRYSDGSYWSSYSTATSLTTNLVNAPTNSSPANAATLITLTPLLEASAFADDQVGHTHAASQWLVDDSSDFSSVVYDSGETVSAETSRAVPGGTLANYTTYYWKVRYKDSAGLWSAYSTATQFSIQISETSVAVRPVFGNTTVDQGDAVKIDAQVTNFTDGSPLNGATVVISIYNSSGTKVVNGAAMSYVSGSNGIYRYAYTVPATSGSYLYEVTATQGSKSGYGASNFEVRTIAADVSSVKSAAETEQAAQEAERVAQAAERAAQEAERVAQEASRAQVTSIQSNLDILIGAMVVTQSTVNDVSPSATAFITSLTNAANNFYKNAVLTFTSGALNGQSRRISGYNGTTKAITLDPALTSAPANGDLFTIVKQNVRVEEQVADHETADAAFRADTTSRLASIEGKVDAIISTLDTVDTNLSAVQTDIDTLRASQQRNYNIELSDVSEIQAGNTYRAKLTVLDFESNPVAAATTPTITIYDAARAVAQVATDMTALSTGVYEYTAAISSAATAGLWETVVSVDVAGSADITRNDYWQVTGAPAQVVINSMSDLTVPSIAAATTITNEGGGAYEYQYEWCVVAAQENQCGGNDDVYYASAAKLIAAGEDFNPTLTATVPNTGNYWFKVVVYYGTEASGAARSFAAVVADEEPAPGGGGSSGGGSSSGSVSQLDTNSQKLANILEILGRLDPVMQGLLSVSTMDTEKLTDIQNKVADLKAVSAATRRIVEQQTTEPIVETYMKFNSVEVHFLITNPADTAQTVKFRAFLPEEARPEIVLELDGLRMDYDANAKAYYVSGDIALGPRETVTKRVEMKDIWVFTDEAVRSIKQQAESFADTLKKTQYGAQAVVLKNDIDSTLGILMARQAESYSSPQDHILAYRENQERMRRAESNLQKLGDLVVESGASQGLVGRVGGIQTFATWGIILAILFGFALLAAVIFAMWRHQMRFAAALGVTSPAPVRSAAASHPVSERAALVWIVVIVAILLAIAALYWIAPAFLQGPRVLEITASP